MRRALRFAVPVIALSMTACVAYVPPPEAGYPAAPPYAGYPGQPVPLAQAPPAIVYQTPGPYYYPPPYSYGPAYYGPAYVGPSVGLYFGGGGHHGGRR